MLSIWESCMFYKGMAGRGARGGENGVRETSAALPLSIPSGKIAIEQYKAIYQRAIWFLSNGTCSGRGLR